MIYFSLGNDISPEKIIRSIQELLNKNIENKQDAKNSFLVISIKKVSQTIEKELTKIE